MPRAFYSNSIDAFLASSSEDVVRNLTTESSRAAFPVLGTQLAAWDTEIEILKDQLVGKQGAVYLEFSIPRMGRRVDAILLVGPAILAIEFKVGSSQFEREALDQVWDYALDLKNFHEPSHAAVVVPVLISTDAPPEVLNHSATEGPDHVWSPVSCGRAALRRLIDDIITEATGTELLPSEWEGGRYSPTPTIVEAARALYNNHSVAEISRSDAGGTNLTRTSESIERVIRTTRENGEKAICFVTGVPGSGKTLVGLNIATRHSDPSADEFSVYLSGNGPLISVLSEALVRDKASQLHAQGKPATLRTLRSEVKAFIQNVHTFRDEYFQDPRPPREHVAIFDEAQRAWDEEQTSRFLRNRKNISSTGRSEPDLLLQYMARHDTWSVVVCLVGEGQEINTGEAGIQEWFRAVDRLSGRWRIFTSGRLEDPNRESTPSRHPLEPLAEVLPELHLSSSIRSFRAENIARLIESVLRIDPDAAKVDYQKAISYPIVLTRDLRSAKSWLRSKTRGTERCGLVVSSSAERLRPHAIDVRARVDPVHWFLDGPDDTRSSVFLEDAATEFQVQGLEVDWSCVVWDADLRYDDGFWKHWKFTGSRWNRVRSDVRTRYLENAYRVLLTRARQGMVIVVPPGDQDDPTRLPEFYDPTFEYLRGIGFTDLK